jgi:hypothetical protein
MEVNLKVKKDTFDKIESGILNSIKHGFSKNKKYSRLFCNPIESVTLICDETKRVLIKQFKSIETIITKDKKYIQINFI